MVADESDRSLVEGAEISDFYMPACEDIVSKARLVTPRSMRDADSLSEQLKRLNLTDSQGHVIKAGLLVAGTYPQQFFPKLNVDVAVHPGVVKGASSSVRFRDRTICEGTLGEMIEDAVGAVAKNLRRRAVIDGTARSDELEIPVSVVREAVSNALIHRSYNKRFDGEGVSVDIYDDRVEITNPGGLWGKSKSNLADGRSCCRNATIMRLMSLAPLPDKAGSPAEGNGSGILFMINEMEARGIEPPKFQVGIDFFKVVLARPTESKARSRNVLKGEAFIENLLRQHGEMSLQELVEKSGLSVSQVRRRVNDLIADGRVEGTAPLTSRKRKYRIVGQPACMPFLRTNFWQICHFYVRTSGNLATFR